MPYKNPRDAVANMRKYRRSHPEKVKRWNKNLSEMRKNRLRDLKKEFGGKCKICGYDKCLGALDFHHRSRSTKKFEIGKSFAFSIDRLRKEARKCNLICANCHREIEMGL